MTKLRVACVAGILLLSIAPTYAVAQASIRDGALQDWIALKDTMMKIADAMPEDKFTYRATPAERTWGEQILHVAEANVNQIGRPRRAKPHNVSSDPVGQICRAPCGRRYHSDGMGG
jgi:hypothetical protein